MYLIGMTQTHVPDWVAEAGPVISSLDDPSIMLLRPAMQSCVFEYPVAGIMVKHPWVNSATPMVGMLNKLYDAKFSEARRLLSQRDLKTYLLVIVEPPWLLDVISNWWQRGKLTPDELAELLMWCWSSVEFPSFQHGAEILELWNDAGFNTDDQEGWDSLPDVITVYRGGTEHGVSWTTDLDIAKFFQRRVVQGEAGLWQTTVTKQTVKAYITERKESEIIIDPTGLDISHVH